MHDLWKAVRVAVLLVFSLAAMVGCTLRAVDDPKGDGSNYTLEARLEILCSGCTPENLSGQPPFFVVFDATKSKGDIAAYAITILNEVGDIVYGPVHEAVAAYTFEVPGSYQIVLEIGDIKGNKATVRKWVFVQGPEQPSIEWLVGKFVDIAVRAPETVALGERFEATVSFRVHAPMEFLYINVFAFGSIRLNSKLETTINQPKEMVYEFAVTGTGEREGKGTLLIEVQGGPPSENEKRSIERTVQVQR